MSNSAGQLYNATFSTKVTFFFFFFFFINIILLVDALFKMMAEIFHGVTWRLRGGVRHYIDDYNTQLYVK